MKKIIFAALLTIALMLGMSAVSFAAPKSPYPDKPYKVTVYSGRQGHFTKAGDGTLNAAGTVWTKNYAPGEQVKISRDILGFVPKEGSKYYDRGFRVAGHDNDEIEDETNKKTAVYYTTLEFNADADVDYEIAYGLKGAMVAYKINYVDSSGKTLHATDTYYGMAGDKPVVSYRYVDGYYPNAYTQGKTLVKDEKENVFTFTYTAIPANTSTTVRPAGTTGTTSNTAGSTGTSNAASAANRSTASSTSRTTSSRSTTGTGTNSSSSSSNRTGTSSSSGSNRDSNDSSSSSSSSSTVGSTDRNTDNDNDTSTIDDDETPLAQQPEQYIDIDEEPATFGEFISDHKVPFIIGGIALLGAIGGLIAGLIVHSKNKKKREAEAEEEPGVMPAGQ